MLNLQSTPRPRNDLIHFACKFIGADLIGRPSSAAHAENRECSCSCDKVSATGTGQQLAEHLLSDVRIRQCCKVAMCAIILIYFRANIRVIPATS